MRITLLISALALLIIGGALRACYAPEWLSPALSGSFVHPWQVEADCYSELTRVQHILHGQGLIQNFHPYENWPEGMMPTLTAPFDYCIILLELPLRPVTAYPLDWAGALVSPVLWLGLFLFWTFYRSSFLSGGSRLLLLLGGAALPALVWATSCGRPRHISLILLLLALAISAEYERWLTKERAWHLAAGIFWGLACWTSLYEPLFLFAVLLIVNFTVRRQENFVFLVSFGVVMLLALLLEGFHLYIPPPAYQVYLSNWLESIAEMRGISFFVFLQQLTPAVFVLPWIGWALWRHPQRQGADLYLIVITPLLLITLFFQERWIYFGSLAELFLLARYVQITGKSTAIWLVLFLFIGGLVASNYYQIDQAYRYGSNQPSDQEEVVARSMDGDGGILGPWWLSAGLGYFSGQPTVACSSHCSIPGIVDSARFFSTTSWVEAYAILEKRKVRWIVVYDNPAYENPLLNNSRHLLGEPRLDDNTLEYPPSIATILINDRLVPPTLQLRSVSQNLKLYEYVPSHY